MPFDKLQHVTDQAFVLLELRGIALQQRVARLFARQDGFCLADEFRPGRWCGESVFYEQVLAIVEQPGIDAARDAVVMDVIPADFDGGR
ncbi:MAG: hypothetical protein QM771_09920 [Nitrospira sp.]